MSVNASARQRQSSSSIQGQSRDQNHAALIEIAGLLTERVAAARQENIDFARWVAHRDRSVADLGNNNATLFRDVAKFIEDSNAAIKSFTVRDRTPTINQPSFSTNNSVTTPKLIIWQRDLGKDEISS
ncbi:hypothetical protein RRF57_001585 [Xylaria bambusicola]|uniref:Uncharacterized protein n=1 Tax=Xylaria bambusicola TaxID=326684 RepID=A0AAN7UBR0_9PEZI